MRTNIVLNDDLVEEAMRYSRSRTRRGLLEEALQTFVEVKSREERLQDYEQKARELGLRLSNLELRQSPHSLLRADRDTR